MHNLQRFKMNKIIPFFMIFGLLAAPAYAQKNRDVLVKIGPTEVSSDEFKRIYERNNSNIPDPAEKKSPEEYLELYINFKLKVLEAHAAGLDTSKAFLEELAGYRAELAVPYLTDVSYAEKQVEETYERMGKELNASHILITFPQNAANDDTTSAFQSIQKIRAEILNGLDFNEAAVRYSQDPSAVQNRGRLGWFTVFQMVAPFEDAAYRTAPGQISLPVRSAFGYHLIKIHDVRKVKGEIKVAHIMKIFPQGMTPEMKADLKNRMDSIYSLLVSGADFQEMARSHSDDQKSAANGGEIPYFGQSRMIPEFSDPAFALENDGDFTSPVETSFGYHIIKRLDLKPMPDFQSIRNEVVERIRRDPERSTQNKELFLSKLKQEYGFSRNEENISRAIEWASEELSGGNPMQLTDDQKDMVLFTLNGKSFTAGEWFTFLNSGDLHTVSDPDHQMDGHYAAWEEHLIMKYEDSRLEEKYPEFKSLVQEYYDGLLLFAISEQKIWQQASADTAGLVAFYGQNKSKYMWDERFKGILVSCKDWQTRNELEDKLGPDISISEAMDLAGIHSSQVSITEGTWSKGDNPIVDYYVWNAEKPGNWNPANGFIMGNMIEPEPKLLEEARGFHISDYQQHLEENWIIELRKKYTVEINRKALKKL